MQMTFRWYGEGNDRISLSDIKQIPGVTGIVWALHHKMPGEIWEVSEIAEVKRQLDEYGFNMDVVESVNVHDDIKIGLPTRDKYIENYKQCIRNLSKFGVKVICYNFMPIFDWTRSDLFHPVGDGSTALFYEKNMIQDDYNAMARYILDFTEKYHMSFPGWEPERMAKLDQLFKAYEGIDHEKLWANLKYFLEAIMPTCEECGIKMAIHMDDPPWDIFGLPRLLVDEASIDRFLKMVDHPCNCLTLCSGSLGANPDNDVAAIVRKHCDRIAFAHIRNVKHFENGDFSEASHRDCDGDTGILDILKAYHDCGFEGYIRPDHGRHLWSEGPGTVRPGYGLYDRAMVKDNHLMTDGNTDHLQRCIDKLKSERPGVEVQLEADNLQQVEAFLNLKGVDYILLDNMSNDDMRKAVEMRGQGCKPYFEASGGLTLATAPAAAETGVDFMSFGCLTHSVPSLDLGLDFTVER